jgi:xanthine dehydrogenase accessory factor
MWNDIEDERANLRAEEKPFVIATVVAYKSPQSAKPGSKAIIKDDGSIDGWIGGGCVQPIVLREAKKALETGKPRLVSISPESGHGDWKGVESYEMTCEGGGSLEIYLEPVLPKPELLIIGNSPIAQIVAGLGKLLDFNICVADPEASLERFPEAKLVLTDLTVARNRIGPESYVLVATMGTGDEEGLLAAVGTNPKYLGLVASKQKAKGLFHYLHEKGIPAEELDLVRCPAGLELGGETLPEIALSVMAEITQLRRSASAGPARKVQAATLPIIQKAEPAAESLAASSEARDPVCGMVVETAGARYESIFEDKSFYFCCLRCKESFDRSPQIYPT